MPESTATAARCALCERRGISTAAVTTDDFGRPACFVHASRAYRDEQTTIRTMTGFASWHDEQASRHDALVAESRQERSKDKNRALARAHRLAADAIRRQLREGVKAD